ncbi:hypothetical protein N9V19_01650 [Opitutales bacterium]|nr:hypothetical protein [Opitutales bacterium]MDB2310681.1 hypothetical protein [Opitutales bacterium]
MKKSYLYKMSMAGLLLSAGVKRRRAMKLKKQGLLLCAALTGCALSSQAEVLYSENFDDEGGAGQYDAANGGTTPEVNIGGIGVLQSNAGASQGGDAGTGPAAWYVQGAGFGVNGLRFGANENWATGSNSAAILAGGGFIISYDMDVNALDASYFTTVRVGSGAENSGVNAVDVDFGVFTRGDGRMQTYDNGASQGFGSAGATTAVSVELKYEFNSWAAGTTVTFTGYVDGQEVATDTFTWDGTDDVKILFGGHTAGYLIDNIAVSSIPVPDYGAVLYSENFDGEGGAGAYDDGTTPEVNVGNIGTLEMTGASQGGDGTGDTWKLNGGVGQYGLRFGATNENWATGANSAAILAAGGFSISYDFNAAAGSWVAVRVGNGDENGRHNDTSNDLFVFTRPDGRMSTYDNGSAQNFGTAGAETNRTVEYRYEFDSWAAGTTVTFTGLVDGSVVANDTFTWDGTDDVQIVLTGHASANLIDNLVVSKIVTPPLGYGGVYTDTASTVALWHMDALNASGKVDDDDSVVTGRNADLGVNGAVLVDPAVTVDLDYPDPNNSAYGQCIYLDGVDDYLPVANSALAIDPSALRIEFWAKSDAAVAGQYIFDRWGQILVFSDATGFQVRVYDASAATQDHYARPAGFDPTDWNHLAIEVIGEDLDIYVNGELVIDSATISGGMSTTTAKTTTYFGMRYNNTGHFAGYLDEVRISSLTPPAPTLREFDTPVAVVAPTIDGIVSLGEWGDAFELPMVWPELGELPNVGSLSGDALEATPSDISAVFSFKWDATNLYILAEVTDDILIKPDAAGSAGYPDDHFLLGLDPDVTDGDIAASVFLTEFGINTNDVAAAYYNGNAIANPALNDFSNHEVEGSIVAGGYVIELALRWADLGVISPVATDMIGVSILLFDNDVDDGERDILMKSIGDVTIPSEYHQVTLAGAMNTFANYISQYDVGVFDQPTDDPDLDGVDNHTEYALGGDPSVSDAPSMQPTSEANAGGNEFTYIYNRRIGASALGLTYTVEVETDLANADWNTGGVTEDGAVVIDDEFEEVTNTVNMTEDEKFLRLNIN